MSKYIETPRVFIVDDMEVNLKIARHALKDSGYELFCFSDPRKALSSILEIKPHIFLLDVEMPHFTGLEVARKIRSIPVINQTPIIFVTTLTEDSTIQNCFESGATDFVNKPYNYLEFRLRVKNILDQYMIFRSHTKLLQEYEVQTDDLDSLNKILVHDLSNHITSLKFQLKKMLRDNTGPEKIERAIHRVEEVISHVKEMMALESGKKSITLTGVDLLEATLSAKESMDDKCTAKGVEILVDEASFKEVLVTAQRSPLVHQVIENIFTNSIKFSHKGAKIKVSGQDLGSGEFLFEVDDEGVGMPLEILSNLFNKFKKTTRLGTDNEAGTGFGMPLVKTYLDHFGAKVNVESYTEKDSEASGTTFRITFKRA